MDEGILFGIAMSLNHQPRFGAGVVLVYILDGMDESASQDVRGWWDGCEVNYVPSVSVFEASHFGESCGCKIFKAQSKVRIGMRFGYPVGDSGDHVKCGWDRGNRRG